jgi:hypothetical protein
VLISWPLGGLAAQLCEELARLGVVVVDGDWMDGFEKLDEALCCARRSLLSLVGVWKNFSSNWKNRLCCEQSAIAEAPDFIG